MVKFFKFKEKSLNLPRPIQKMSNFFNSEKCEVFFLNRQIFPKIIKLFRKIELVEEVTRLKISKKMKYFCHII